MKFLIKGLVVFSSILFSQIVFADWTYVGYSTSSTQYIDTSTIKKSGNGTYKYWTLVEYNENQTSNDGSKYRSLVSQSETDCINQTSRVFYIIVYSDIQGSGEVVDNEKATAQWKPLAPNSTGISENEFVCNFAKKKKNK